MIVFAGLLIATSFPARHDVAQSAAASQPAEEARAATPVAPAPKVILRRLAWLQRVTAVRVLLCRFADAAMTWLEAADFEKLLFGEGGVDAYGARRRMAGSTWQAAGWQAGTPCRNPRLRPERSGAEVDSTDWPPIARRRDADLHFPTTSGSGWRSISISG